MSTAPLVADVDADVAELFRARTAAFAFHRARLRFDLATTVFSSAGVDPGSALLLRHLQTIELPPAARVLDLGCGHGVLGLVLLALDRQRHVTMVDRDALACHFTARNLVLNELPAEQVVIGGSLGYDDVPRHQPYDLIVSNLPGKAGDAVIEDLTAGPGPWSRPGTVTAVVVVAPLAGLVRDSLSGPAFELLVDRGNKAHQVLIARRLDTATNGTRWAGSAFEAGLYDRDEVEVRAADLAWTARTVTGLDEFDSLSHATVLLRGAMRGVRGGPCTVVNPGQGHRALIAARSGQRVEHLVSRDLLALRASRRLLATSAAGVPGSGSVSVAQPELHHALSPPLPGPGSSSNLILHADDKVHTPWLVHELKRWLAALPPRGTAPGTGERQLVLTGRAGLLGRIEADLLSRTPGRLAYKHNRHGYRVIRYQYRA